MKIIVFGLGNFGMSLAISLTETGNEVIGVDKNIEKVNLVKDKISHAIAMDSTNELSYEALPLKDTDKVVVAIGENEGAAIITTAIIKKLSDVKIISRALSPIHDSVLEAMGIHSIVHPEQESADRLTKQINFKSKRNFEPKQKPRFLLSTRWCFAKLRQYRHCVFSKLSNRKSPNFFTD